MNYISLMHMGFKFVLKEILKHVSQNGFFANNCIYITFKTTFPGAVIPSYLLEKYPDKMTIILQHEFWDLNVNETYFSVSLLFNGILENLTIPFDSIYNVQDPNEDFSLDFFVDETFSKNSVDFEDSIINLDAFRKNKSSKH